MLNLRLISKIFGSLLLIEAWLMFWCLIIAICHGGNDIIAFSASIVLTIA
jgi:trk system potassium uptake protein TrkH